MSQLGETLATNITQKGVSASASDGLTTLANKVLQISGGGSTAIYESDMTTDDGNWVRTGGTATITYNSSGLLVKGTNTTDTYYLIDETKVTIPHQDIVVEFNIVATIDGTYSDSTQFCVYDTMIHSRNGKLTVTNLANTQYAQMTMPSYPIAVKMECGDTNTLVYVNNSLFTTVPNTTWVGVGLRTYNNRSMTINNVKITDNGSPYSPCTEYIEEINNAIEYINGSGS